MLLFWLFVCIPYEVIYQVLYIYFKFKCKRYTFSSFGVGTFSNLKHVGGKFNVRSETEAFFFVAYIKVVT